MTLTEEERRVNLKVMGIHREEAGEEEIDEGGRLELREEALVRRIGEEKESARPG
jgi:hypothetical protein